MIEELLIDAIFLKIGEKLVERGWESVKGKTNMKSSLEDLKKNFKLLSAKAYDVDKEIRVAERSGKKKCKKEVEEWLEEVKQVESEIRGLENEVQLEGLIEKFFGGDREMEVMVRVCELVEQSRYFGELVLDDDTMCARGEALLATKLVGEAFDDNMEKICKFLAIGEVSSIGIYGMGGVGKTSLAKHINNKLLETTDMWVLWVTISQEGSIMMLQDKIARVLHLDLRDEDDEEKRAATLNRALSQRKKLVLILDDMWRYINLEKVGVVPVEGCTLMITTRSLEVCRRMGCQEIIAVKPLDDDEGWKLFRKKLGSETVLTQQGEEVAKCVAKACSGLPLAIITIAGSMRGETDIRTWRNALHELKKRVMVHHEMEDEVFKVLKYSFDRLDHNQKEKRNGYTSLQLCFLYCALYPEDCNIRRDYLARKFISQELVDRRKNIEGQLDEGHSILNRLVNVSLLEIGVDFEDRNCVKMHDVVRSMALSICKDKRMVIAGQYCVERIPDEDEWRSDVEQVSLTRNRIKKIEDGISPNCPNLSTLLLQWNPLRVIGESFFRRMGGLCFLDMCGTEMKELPNSVSDLEGLKTLLLGGCLNLEHVPYLGKLKALRELDLSYTAIRCVPDGMERLVNLRYLSLFGADHLQMSATTFLLNLSGLQHLGLPLQIEAQLEVIQKLQCLEEFEGRFREMTHFNRFMESRQTKSHSVAYCVMVGKFNTYFEVSEVYERTNKLIVHCYDLENRDNTIMLLADDIEYLQLHECKGLRRSFLENFTKWPKSLQKLEIIACEGIECIFTSDQLMSDNGSRSRLEEIELESLDDFIGLVIHSKQLPPRLFSSLTRLSISNCNKMIEAGLPCFLLQSLQEISVESCQEIQEIIGVGEGEAPRLVLLPKLTKLHLKDLPKLTTICKLSMVCNSLEVISLSECTRLKKLPLHFGASTVGPPALREIELIEEEREWWNSLEWDHPSHSNLLHPFLKFQR